MCAPKNLYTRMANWLTLQQVKRPPSQATILLEVCQLSCVSDDLRRCCSSFSTLQKLYIQARLWICYVRLWTIPIHAMSAHFFIVDCIFKCRSSGDVNFFISSNWYPIRRYSEPMCLTSAVLIIIFYNLLSLSYIKKELLLLLRKSFLLKFKIKSNMVNMHRIFWR